MYLTKAEIGAILLCITAYECADEKPTEGFSILLQRCRKKLNDAAHEPDHRSEALRKIEELHELVRNGL